MTVTDQAARVIRLTTGGTSVGISLDRVFGVERADRLRPNAQPGTLGSVVNRAGEWPVVELAEMLGQSNTADRSGGQVVLLELHGLRMGLLVDRVSSTDRDVSEMQPVPRSAGRIGPFAGVLDQTDDPLLVLDLERLLGSDDEPSGDVKDTPPPVVNGRQADRLVLFAQVVCESLGGRPVGFAVPAGCVTEIADTPTGTAVPSGGPHVRDIIWWRGQPVTVIDTASWCEVPVPAPASRRVVFVRTPRRETVGLLAGVSVKVLPLPLPHLPTRRQLPFQANRVMGVFDLSDVTIVIPNLARLTAI